MQIDNYEQATALTKKLEAAVPFRVRPNKQFLKMMDERETVEIANWLEVDRVMYSGDMGGIMVSLQPGGESSSQVYSTSLTHMTFDPDHALAAEVKAYQRQRVRRLKLQDRGGFAAELLSQTLGKKRKSRKGFG